MLQESTGLLTERGKKYWVQIIEDGGCPGRERYGEKRWWKRVSLTLKSSLRFWLHSLMCWNYQFSHRMPSRESPNVFRSSCWSLVSKPIWPFKGSPKHRTLQFTLTPIRSHPKRAFAINSISRPYSWLIYWVPYTFGLGLTRKVNEIYRKVQVELPIGMPALEMEQGNIQMHMQFIKKQCTWESGTLPGRFHLLFKTKWEPQIWSQSVHFVYINLVKVSCPY